MLGLALCSPWALGYGENLKDFPEISDRDIIIEKLDNNLSEMNLNKEFEFFSQDFAKGFEELTDGHGL